MGISDQVEFVEPNQLRQRVESGEKVAIIDVRSADEFVANQLPGAINIPADQLENQIGELAGHAAIVTVCNFGGARSCGAAKKLKELGFGNVSPLREGLRGWQEEHEYSFDTKAER
ncbi:MAG: rhodanese-like domain-containing protein [Gammaproteobacteria bacterium]|nr:rhodanese-like domain-containing protein [Gammaproteobacteria bacterium]